MNHLSDCFVLKNGVKIPCLGYDTWRTPKGNEAAQAVRDTVAAEYRRIDTVQLYGNEKSVGTGIRELGIPREELFVITKLRNTEQGYDKTLAICEESLWLLGLEYLDLYLIRWPTPALYQDNWKQVSRDTWKAFECLYDEKLVRAIGLSNFLPHHTENIEAEANIQPMADQLEIHPLFTQKDTVAYCRKKRIQVQAWSPLGHGTVLDNQVLCKIGSEYHKSSAQTALRWGLQRDTISITKFMNPGRMVQNTDISDSCLTAQECVRTTGLGEDGRTGPDPDYIGF